MSCMHRLKKNMPKGKLYSENGKLIAQKDKEV